MDVLSLQLPAGAHHSSAARLLTGLQRKIAQVAREVVLIDTKKA